MGGSSKRCLEPETIEFGLIDKDRAYDQKLNQSDITFGRKENKPDHVQKTATMNKEAIMQQLHTLFANSRQLTRPSEQTESSVESMLFYVAALAQAIPFDIDNDLIKFIEPMHEVYFSAEDDSSIYVGTRADPPDCRKSTDIKVMHDKALYIKFTSTGLLEFIYFGEMRDDLFEGQGLAIYRNYVANGSFSKGELQGDKPATIIYKCGKYYKGQTKNLKPHGIGKTYSFKGEVLSEGEYSIINGKVTVAGLR